MPINNAYSCFCSCPSDSENAIETDPKPEATKLLNAANVSNESCPSKENNYEESGMIFVKKQKHHDTIVYYSTCEGFKRIHLNSMNEIPEHQIRPAFCNGIRIP